MKLTLELFTAILDPEFDGVRLTKSAKEWVIDTLELRYRILSVAQEKSARRVELRAQQSTREAGGTWKPADVERAAPSPRLQYCTHYPNHTPGSVALWIGHDISRFEGAFPASGEIHLETMLSGAPSDFYGTPASMLYAAIDLEVAVVHAK